MTTSGRIAQIVSRFDGETIGSGAIRARRMGALYEFADADNTSLTRKWPVSFLYARPDWRLDERDDEARFIGLANDATVLPLISLLGDWDIVRLLRFGVCDVTLNTNQSNVRFCRECAVHQRHEYGTSWWMRDVNLPFVAVCPIHEVPLYFADRRVVCGAPGYMPHEIMHLAKCLNLKVSEKVVKQAQAVIMLCHRAPNIVSSVFFDYIDTAIAELGITGEYSDFLISCLVPTQSVHNLLHKDLCRRNERPCGEGLCDTCKLDTPLAYFLALTNDPSSTIDALINRSSIIPKIDHSIEELTVSTLSARFQEGNKRFPEILMVRQIINHLKDQSGLLSSTRGALAGSTNERTEKWLRKNLLALIILHWVCPDYLTDFLPITKKIAVLNELKGSERKIVWYAIRKMSTAICGDPERSLRIWFPSHQQSTNPVLGDSFLNLVFWHGRDVLRNLRWKKSGRWHYRKFKYSADSD